MVDNPIFHSRSPSDFWGRRWNRLIHTGLKVKECPFCFAHTHRERVREEAHTAMHSRFFLPVAPQNILDNKQKARRVQTGAGVDRYQVDRNAGGVFGVGLAARTRLADSLLCGILSRRTRPVHSALGKKPAVFRLERVAPGGGEWHGWQRQVGGLDRTVPQSVGLAVRRVDGPARRPLFYR